MKLIKLNLTGKKFGKLAVIKESPNSPRGYKRFWTTFCECGQAKDVEHYSLISGHTKSCGCILKEKTSKRMYKHGKSNSAEYKIWDAMLQRCYNPNTTGYFDYGVKGVVVCDRWKSFENFYQDMGSRPTWRHSINRIDNKGNYEPDNCEWATYKEQARNTSKNKILTYNGETKCISEWAETIGIKSNTLVYRLKRGWSVEEALTYKTNEIRGISKTFYIEAFNQCKHISDWVKETGIKESTIRERLKRGWTSEKALSNRGNKDRGDGKPRMCDIVRAVIAERKIQP